MSSSLSEVQGHALSSFRDFARDIREPKPYEPVISECRGIINTLIGLGQLSVCPYFKWSGNRRLYQVHIKAGKIALNQAASDLKPITVLTVVLATALAARQLMKS